MNNTIDMTYAGQSSQRPRARSGSGDDHEGLASRQRVCHTGAEPRRRAVHHDDGLGTAGGGKVQGDDDDRGKEEGAQDGRDPEPFAPYALDKLAPDYRPDLTHAPPPPRPGR